MVGCVAHREIHPLVVSLVVSAKARERMKKLRAQAGKKSQANDLETRINLFQAAWNISSEMLPSRSRAGVQQDLEACLVFFV